MSTGARSILYGSFHALLFCLPVWCLLTVFGLDSDVGTCVLFYLIILFTSSSIMKWPIPKLLTRTSASVYSQLCVFGISGFCLRNYLLSTLNLLCY